MKNYILKHAQMTSTFDTKYIAQLYFILGRVALPWNFSTWLREAPDILRFSNRKWILTVYTIENL